MGPIGCPETSVRNYHSKLHKIPEEHRCHLNRGRSLKSCIVRVDSIPQEMMFGYDIRKALHSDGDAINFSQTYCVT
jgi:hypothetical protein